MDGLSQLHLGYFVAAMVLYFVVVGAALSFLLSRLGGWAALAKRHRTETPPPAHRKTFQSGQMRASLGYNRCLTIGSNAEGLSLGLFWPLNLAHPRLFVPWAEIEIEEPKRWFFRDVQTLYLGTERIPLRLRTTLVKFLLAGKGASPSPVA